ncbi:hypothetical protein EMIT0P12_60263 [Pseudomonas sp. IT-P12]
MRSTWRDPTVRQRSPDQSNKTIIHVTNSSDVTDGSFSIFDSYVS